MFKLAFYNIFRDLRRTILLSLLLSSSVVFLLVFVGYMNFSREGMEKSFVSSTGHIQIAKENYFNPKFSSLKNELLLEEKDINLIRDEIIGYDELQYTNLIVNFDGLLGNSSTSNPVFAFAYEDPDIITSSLSLLEGEPIFHDSNGGEFLLGSNLAASFGIEKIMETNSDLTLMTNLLGRGLNFQNIKVAGIVKFPFSTADNIFAITTIKTLKDLFAFEGGAHVIQVFLKDNSTLEAFKKKLDNFKKNKGIAFDYNDWFEINPYFKSVLGMTRTTFMFILVLVSLLIFIAFFQIMTALSIERTRELGTLRAIGLTKLELFYSLFLEIVIISVINIVIGVILAYFAKLFVQFQKISFTPPGYSETYYINIFYYASDIIYVSIFMLVLAIFSSILPFSKASKKSVIEVMNDA
ncbi:ABC transporter permease [Borreliella garinii]|uniref:ABC transporter permease n=1 Tax=Borreliella garinii TaxID=29519 RepID=UPI0004E237FB|nr:FtsX-like permease family protein [Borreliella garinii]